MVVHVAFTPAEAVRGSVAVVVDVLPRDVDHRAGAGFGVRPRLLLCRDRKARALRERLGAGLLRCERTASRIDRCDVGASPREFLEPRNDTLILSTTNGTRAILEAAAQTDAVLLGPLLNLDGVARLTRLVGGAADTAR